MREEWRVVADRLTLQSRLRELAARKWPDAPNQTHSLFGEAAAELDRLTAENEALRKDAERLDFFEQSADRGAWMNLVFDDDGRWAVADEGIVALPQVSVFVGSEDQWCDSVRGAIDAAKSK